MMANRETEMPSPINVLVVEDHQDTRDVLAVFLETLGHRFKLVTNAASALDLAAAESFDLLLTDVQLGGRDGWALIRDLRARGCLPPLVASMSAGYGPTQTARSKAEGCHCHLVKPFRWDELQAIMEKAHRADEPDGKSGRLGP